MEETLCSHKDINKLNKKDLQIIANNLLDQNNALQSKLRNDENVTTTTTTDELTGENGPILKMLTDMKTEITEINLSMKALLEENTKLKATLKISKNVTDLLKTQITALEIQANKNDQYSRRECLEISGNPACFENADLEKKALEIFESIGVSLTPEKIHACHRIGKKGQTIIKLVNRKDVYSIMTRKKNLKDTDKRRIGLDGDTRLFINESLCPYYKGLWSKAKRLLNKDLIDSFWTSNGTVKVKLLGEGKVLSVFHDDFYVRNFPGVCLTVSS